MGVSSVKRSICSREPVRVFDDPVGDEVRVHHPEVLVGDDERDVVAVGHDVAQQRVLEGAAAQHVAVDAFHGVEPIAPRSCRPSPEAAAPCRWCRAATWPPARCRRRSPPRGCGTRADWCTTFSSRRLRSFAPGVLLAGDARVFRGVAQHGDGLGHLPVAGQRVLDHPGAV